MALVIWTIPQHCSGTGYHRKQRLPQRPSPTETAKEGVNSDGLLCLLFACIPSTCTAMQIINPTSKDCLMHKLVLFCLLSPIPQFLFCRFYPVLDCLKCYSLVARAQNSCICPLRAPGTDDSLSPSTNCDSPQPACSKRENIWSREKLSWEMVCAAGCFGSMVSCMW